jgi:hypothetical protein
MTSGQMSQSGMKPKRTRDEWWFEVEWQGRNGKQRDVCKWCVVRWSFVLEAASCLLNRVYGWWKGTMADSVGCVVGIGRSI